MVMVVLRLTAASRSLFQFELPRDGSGSAGSFITGSRKTGSEEGSLFAHPMGVDSD